MTRQKPIQILGVIGDPIHHSLSPAMQNRALHTKHLSAAYIPFHVQEKQLPDFLKWALSQKMTGFNVTIPHKETIIPFLDRLTPMAKKIGAVNTVIRRGSRWIGHNTDADGYRLSLIEEKKAPPPGAHIVVFGAGGATRAILHALADLKVGHIWIINRTVEKAQKLAKEFLRQNPKVKYTALPWEKEAWEFPPETIQMVINTTSLGLKGKDKKIWKAFPWKKLPPKAIVSDLVYRPQWTPLLMIAKHAGFRTHSGLGMLLHQGALAFEVWFRQKAPLKAMKRALIESLK